MHLVALPTVALFMLVLLIITVEILTLLSVELGGLLTECMCTPFLLKFRQCVQTVPLPQGKDTAHYKCAGKHEQLVDAFGA